MFFFQFRYKHILQTAAAKLLGHVLIRLFGLNCGKKQILVFLLI